MINKSWVNAGQSSIQLPNVTGSFTPGSALAMPGGIFTMAPAWSLAVEGNLEVSGSAVLSVVEFLAATQNGGGFKGDSDPNKPKEVYNYV